MKRKRILILTLAILLMVSVSFYIFNRSAKSLTSAQRQAALTKILGRKPVLSSSAPKADQVFKGKFVTFVYPGDVKIYTPMLNGKALPKESLEQLIFDIAVPKMSFYMEIDSLTKSVSSVNDLPGVRLRTVQPNLYSKKDITVDNLKGLEFVKQDIQIYEKTAFFFKDSKSYSFSFQGADKIEVNNLYDKIMSSVKFLP